MQDATSQGTANPIQLGSNSSVGDQTKLIVANCTGMYGMDETFSSFNSSNSYVSDYTFWQCHIGSPVNGGGTGKGYATLFDNTNLPVVKGAMLRSYMSNSFRRNPRVVNGIFESSNNLTYGADFYLEIGSPDSQSHADVTEINIRNNGYVKGSQGANFEPILFEDVGTWFNGGYYHQSGNVKDSTITVGMVNNSTSDPEQGTPSSAATPDGWALTDLTDSDAGLLEFQVMMNGIAGARPTNRLQVHQDEFDWCENYLRGSGPTGSYPTSVPNPPTVASVAINHETTGSHGLSPIPTGAGKDVVQGSGYTLLQEWTHDHNDWAMGNSRWRA
jgi:hypothetical protein